MRFGVLKEMILFMETMEPMNYGAEKEATQFAGGMGQMRFMEAREPTGFGVELEKIQSPQDGVTFQEIKSLSLQTESKTPVLGTLAEPMRT
tara:strand:- start:188 stop:460 length:273 start_codon:yes stop_codon:yes gene_type:complete